MSDRRIFGKILFLSRRFQAVKKIFPGEIFRLRRDFSDVRKIVGKIGGEKIRAYDYAVCRHRISPDLGKYQIPLMMSPRIDADVRCA